MNLSNGKSILPVAAICALLSLSACKAYLKATGNYSNPRYEKKADLLAFLSAENARYDEAFVFNNKVQLKYFVDSISPYIPAIIVFDKGFQNYFIDYKCFSAKATGLDSLTKTAAWMPNSRQIQLKLQEELSSIDTRASIAAGNKDLYVFYVWARFYPKKSQEMIGEVTQLYNNLHDRVYVGAINVDMQSGWE